MTHPTLPEYVFEQGKADFMDHLYDTSGRTNSLYTALWEEFVAKHGDIAPTLRLEWILANTAQPK
jgi:hypothetical protein